MGKNLSIIRALVDGSACIHYIDKIPIKRTPGDTTVVGHN
jgi:hypothetical protein